MRRAYQSLHRRANAELRRRFHVTADQSVVLSLHAEQDAVSQQEHCLRCLPDPSTIGVLLRLTESRGWVARWPEPHEAHRRRVHRTRAGRRLQAKLWEAAGDSSHRDLRAVPASEEEKQIFLDTLDRVVAAMDRGTAGAAG